MERRLARADLLPAEALDVVGDAVDDEVVDLEHPLRMLMQKAERVADMVVGLPLGVAVLLPDDEGRDQRRPDDAGDEQRPQRARRVPWPGRQFAENGLIWRHVRWVRSY